MSLPRRRPPPATFRPGLTLILLYLGAFFLLFSFLLVVPALWPLLDASSARTEAELEALARETAQTAIRGRLGIAFGLAFLATAAGGMLKILPGIGRRDAR